MMYQCAECGLNFEGYGPRKFCGHLCANRWRARNAQKWASYRCERCGVEVTVQARQAKTFRFCTPCRAQSHGERLNAAPRSTKQRGDPVTLTCRQCGKPFTILACFAKYRQFCGRECFSASRVGKPSLHKVAETASFGVGGFRPDLGMYCRSRWEANYIRYLRLTNMPFTYEQERFTITLTDGSQHAYTPDFLVDGRHYVEIKGWMREDRRQAEVLRAAQQQLPRPLVLLRESQYRALERSHSARIPTWEFDGDGPPEMPKRECSTCGKELTSVHRKAQFCSRTCSNVRYRTPRETRTCPTCGTTFTVSETAPEKKKFCSRTCVRRSPEDIARRTATRLALNGGEYLSPESRAKMIESKRRRRAAMSL